MEKLVKINWEDLGKVFSNKLAIEENISISDNIKDLEEDILHASQDLVKERDNSYLYLCKVEYKDRNGIPSFLEFYEENIIDENDFIIEINYYIENCDSKYLKTEFLEEVKKETATETLMLIEKLQDNLQYLRSQVNSVYDTDVENTLKNLKELKENMMRW